MAIQWRDSLAIGIESIDSQHQELFKQADNLLEACNQRKGKEEVGTLVKFLEDYVVVHFGEEEKMQQKYGYPDYKEHKAQHDKFIADFAGIKKKFESEGATLQFVTSLNRTVVDWLIKHIGSADKALGTFIKSK